MMLGNLPQSVLFLTTFALFCDAVSAVYTVSSDTILRDGQPWVPVGVNAMSSYGKASKRSYPEKLSIVREYVIMDRQKIECYPSGCWASKVGGSWLHPLDALLDRNELEGIVTIVDLHKWDENTELWAKVPSETDFYEDYLDKLVNYYVPALKDRSEAWLSIWNEPFEWDSPSDVKLWKNEMEAILESVRAANYTNIVVVPAGQMGQDETVLLGGDAKDLADRYGPIVFDIHVYNKWLNPTVVADIPDRLAAIKAEGLAILVGETGPSNAGQVYDVQPLLEAAVDASIGVCGWVWKCRNGAGDKNALRKPTSPWCQTWELNNEDNENWGSLFNQYLDDNTV